MTPKYKMRLPKHVIRRTTSKHDDLTNILLELVLVERMLQSCNSEEEYFMFIYQKDELERKLKKNHKLSVHITVLEND